MGADPELARHALALLRAADQYDYSYQWSWLGVPIIQMPPDIVATQEIIWECRPQVIVETGIARGGSAILHGSVLELLSEGQVIAVDIDIRPHNREAIEDHPCGHRVSLIQGSSVDPTVVGRIQAETAGVERVMVVLDSDHTHDHVLAELEAYAPLVTPGQFLVVADTAIDRISPPPHRERHWGPGNSPASALQAYLATTSRFIEDPFVNAKLLMTATPGGYLRCLEL
jgi:cephalosporin hydroxylase